MKPARSRKIGLGYPQWSAETTDAGEQSVVRGRRTSARIWCLKPHCSARIQPVTTIERLRRRLVIALKANPCSGNDCSELPDVSLRHGLRPGALIPATAAHPLSPSPKSVAVPGRRAGSRHRQRLHLYVSRRPRSELARETLGRGNIRGERSGRAVRVSDSRQRADFPRSIIARWIAVGLAQCQRTNLRNVQANMSAIVGGHMVP